MKASRWGVLLTILTLLFNIQPAITRAEIGNSESSAAITVEFLDGHTTTVVPTRISEAGIFVRTSTGGYTILPSEISVKTLRQLNLTAELTRREDKKRKEEFEKTQREKGLIEFNGKWVSKEEKQQLIEAEERQTANSTMFAGLTS